MSFLQPLGLLLALALPLIALLHFRKRQLVEKQVSFLGFWDQVIREVQGVKSKKINRYLLLLLQLLIGLLIVLALARPVWLSSFQGKELTLALDCSLTMQAEEQGGTRFQKAREELIRYLEKVPGDVRVNLVLLKNKSQLLLQAAGKDQIIHKIRDIYCTNEALNVETAAEILAVCPGSSVVISDKELPLGDQWLKVGGVLENLGLTGGSYDYYSHTALCRVKNYGTSSRSAVLRLEDEQGRQEVQKVDILAGTETDVSWPGVWPEAQILQITIAEQDMLPVDNRWLLPVGKASQKQVLLVGEDYYLTRALTSIPYINVATQKQWEGGESNYDLYIIKKELSPGTLPPGAKVWWLSPPQELQGRKIKDPVPLKLLPGSFARNLELREVYAASCPVLNLREGEKTVLEAGGKAVMAYGSKDGAKYLYSTLDWNNTNLPLLPGFPILVDNIINWFLPEVLWQQPGDEVFPEKGKAMKLVDPVGTGRSLEVPLLLEQPGIYNVTEGKSTVKTLVVNPPPEPVSGEPPGEVKTGEQGNAAHTLHPSSVSSYDLQKTFILLLLVLLAVEWQVFKREF